MVNVAKQQARCRLVDDQSDVAADAYRPEVLVLRLVELLEAHARVGLIQLQIKGRRLRGLLFLACEPREAVGECVSDAKLDHLKVRRSPTSLVASACDENPPRRQASQLDHWLRS